MAELLPVHVGVDVGGTNTDAVVISCGEVIGWSKHVTTADIMSGVSHAVRQALIMALEKSPSVGKLKVLRVHIGTTHFLNAVLQRQHLARVAVIRLCGAASQMLPPFSDFQDDLREVIHASTYMVDGGYDFDGIKEICPLDENQIVSTLHQLKKDEITNVVVSCIFSIANENQENKVAELIAEHQPSLSFTLTHHVGRLGLLERENAAILNESLKPLCQQTVCRFEEALAGIGLHCPFYLTQNDGTLMSIKQAQKLPVLTFASGSTNSMRGAAYLSGVQDAVVVDIGGTSTDVGMLIKGFPRQASFCVEVAGVRTNFSMPDVLSIGLGGGSLVTASQTATETQVKVGPQSVGYRLEQDAMIFGGTVLTASDVAVAGGRVDMGSPEKLGDVKEEVVKRALERIHIMVEETIDRVKVSSDEVPVILVGGGSILIDRSRTLKGIRELIVPPHHSVANAVGAALSQVAAAVDYVIDLSNMTRDKGVTKAEELARQNTVLAGADADSVQITEVNEVPLTYLPSNVTRVHVRAVGDLLVNDTSSAFSLWDSTSSPPSDTIKTAENPAATIVSPPGMSDDLDCFTTVDRSPVIDHVTGEWNLTEYDVECLAVGTGILGCGGGGSPHNGKVQTIRALRDGKRIRVITPERFTRTVREGGCGIAVAQMGAPTVLTERLNSQETIMSVRCLEGVCHTIRSQQEHRRADGCLYTANQGGDVTYLDHFEVPGSRLSSSSSPEMHVAALIPAEIGGTNGLEALWTGGYMDLPILDCDLMGRAFPELQMCVNFMNGHPVTPACLCDYNGRLNVILEAPTPKHLENHFRKICIEMGCSASVVFAPFFKNDLVPTDGQPQKIVMHSLSRAWRLGNAVMESQRLKISAVNVILEHEGGRLLITGKVYDLQRMTTGGFAKGSLKVEGSDEFRGETLLVEFQNEHLVASRTDANGNCQVLVSVPDLIAVVDSERGQPITVENLRYGLRVAVLGMPAPPTLTTGPALSVVGPQAFGYPSDRVEFKHLPGYVNHAPVPLV